MSQNPDAAPLGVDDPLVQRTAPRSEDPAHIWREKYLKAHRRSQTFAATTVIGLVAAVGGVAWGVTQQSDSTTTVAADAPTLLDGGQLPDGFLPPDGFAPGDGRGFGDGMGQRGGAMLEGLFDEDGSVNTEAVDQFLALVPEGLDATRLVERGLMRGSITEEQADALREAFGAADTSGTGGI